MENTEFLETRKGPHGVRYQIIQACLPPNSMASLELSFLPKYMFVIVVTPNNAPSISALEHNMEKVASVAEQHSVLGWSRKASVTIRPGKNQIEIISLIWRNGRFVELSFALTGSEDILIFDVPTEYESDRLLHFAARHTPSVMK